MSDRQAINPDWPWAKDFRISQAVRVGNTIYVSGQGPLSVDGEIVGPGDMLAQSRQVFANIREVLSAAGAAMSDVVKITAFITDVDRYNEYKTARTEAFPAAIPASSTVTSPVLVLPEMLVEVEAVAVVSA